MLIIPTFVISHEVVIDMNTTLLHTVQYQLDAWVT